MRVLLSVVVCMICATVGLRAVQASEQEPTPWYLPKSAKIWPNGGSGPLGITELSIGWSFHDAGVFGRNEEQGTDFTFEMRSSPLRGSFFDFLKSPRVLLGMNLNDAGDSSSIFVGLTWDWPFWERYFFSFDLGGAYTNATGEKELGCDFLFREGARLGFIFRERHSLALRLDHISHGKLCGQNEGLDTFGVAYSFRF